MSLYDLRITFSVSVAAARTCQMSEKSSWENRCAQDRQPSGASAWGVPTSLTQLNPELLPAPAGGPSFPPPFAFLAASQRPASIPGAPPRGTPHAHLAPASFRSQPTWLPWAGPTLQALCHPIRAGWWAPERGCPWKHLRASREVRGRWAVAGDGSNLQVQDSVCPSSWSATAR